MQRGFFSLCIFYFYRIIITFVKGMDKELLQVYLCSEW